MKSLLFVVLLLFSNVEAQAQQYYQVATETLNVRKSPSGKAAVVSQFTLDDSIQVIGRVGTWSKVALEDGSFGYVSSRFLSEEFKKDEPVVTKTSSRIEGSTWEIYTLIGFAVLALLIRMFFSGSSSSNSGKNKNIRSRPAAAQPKAVVNEDIIDVRLESNWYKVYNSDGKQLSLKGGASYIYLIKFSSKFILMDESNWYKLYDCKFKQIAIKGVLKGDRVISVSLNTITIQEGAWIKTYDTNFKQINVRAAR